MDEFVHDLVVGQRTQEEARLWQMLSLAIYEADDLNAALAAVLEGVCTTMGWTGGQAWLPQPDETALVSTLAWYASDKSLEPLRAIDQQLAFGSGTLPERAWSTKQAAWSDNIALNPPLSGEVFAQAVSRTAGIAIPVCAGPDVVAVLELFVCADHGPDQRSIEQVSAVVAQLGAPLQRKQAEDLLRRSEARYRAVVDSVSDAIITITTQGMIQSFNRGAERAFGYAAADVIGQPLALLMPERLRKQYTLGFQRSLQKRRGRMLGYPREAIGRRRDGTEFPLELTINEVREGSATFYAVILRSITQRKLTEAMLERQTETLRWQAQLLDLANDAILVREFHSSRILLWSRGAETLYGWTPAEALGQPSHTLLHTDTEQPLEEITAALLQNESWSGELTHIKRDGTMIVVASRWAVQRNEQGEPVSVLEINTDITERKRVELESVRLLAAEQEHSKRLRELAALKADFTAMVAHELESPLSAIRIFADLLAAGVPTAEQEAQIIAAIQGEIKMLTSLVGDVRTSSAMERDDFVVRRRPMQVVELLESAAAFAETLPGEHPVVVTLAEAIVLADADRIGQVLRNLLSNAAKYSPPGSPIELRAILDDTWVRIEVADHGPGIHPGDLQHIFEKFGRGRDQTGKRVAGLGLGLYLSRRIVQAHNTSLELYSTPGAGSVFTFELEVVTGSS